MKAFLLFCFILSTYIVNAQNSVIPGGGNTSDNGGSISYSLGYIANLNGISADGSLSGGLQQPYEISVITGFINNEINLDIKTYPNPASHYLILSTGSTSLKNLSYTVSNIEGKTIRRGYIQSSQTMINLSGVKNATYIIRVYSSQKTLKIFRIVKAN